MHLLERLAVESRNITCLPGLHLLAGITLAIWTRNRLSKLHSGRGWSGVGFVHQVFLLVILAEEFQVYVWDPYF